MKTFNDIQYGGLSRQTLDLYTPETPKGGVIVYFHGGGIEDGDKRDKNYVEIAEKFCKNGYAFASVNYILYPQGARYPEYLEDCARAVGFIKKHMGEYGFDKIYVSGQSAGAWISLMLCFDKQFLRRECVENSDIKGWIIDSAQTTSHFNVLHYETGVDKRAQRIDRYSPMFYLGADSAFSRMFVIYYSRDMACRKEQNLLFVRAVKEFLPEADIEMIELDGTHCSGSVIKGSDGEYPFAVKALEWLKKVKA